MRTKGSKMAARRGDFVITVGVFTVLLSSVGVVATPEQGKWSSTIKVTGEHVNQPLYAGFVKTMYNETSVAITVTCESLSSDSESENPFEFKVGWMLRFSDCFEEFVDLGDSAFQEYYDSPQQSYPVYDYGKYQKVEYPETYKCGDPFHLVDLKPIIQLVDRPLSVNGSTEKRVDEAAGETSLVDPNTRSRRAPEPKRKGGAKKKPAAKPAPPAPPAPPAEIEPTKKEEETKTEEVAKEVETESQQQQQEPEQQQQEPKAQETVTEVGNHSQIGDEHSGNVVTHSWESGPYLLVVRIMPVKTEGVEDYQLTVGVSERKGTSYLSATDWALLPFYGVMCGVYVLYGVIWLLFLACQWRDLLRIQFWVGGVIILGMLEKAVFYAEYQHVNSTGVSVRGAVVFAELVSCLKRTLARMLVIIVCLGYGIVKPRLGPMLHRVLGVGALYFILGSVEGCLRSIRPKQDPTNQALLASIPLAVLDSAICWWIFSSLVQTTRTLRLRRNLVKLSLYRHFTNTLIFAVLASIAFMIWSFKTIRFTQCLSDWSELWVDEAYWHLLFSVILMVIMALWRPTANNQRYAFSPLTEEQDVEAEEPMLNDAFEGMKMRGLSGKNNANGNSPGRNDTDTKAEEDLKWIEENIPSSVADTALPSLLDSDEEIMTTRFEMNKME
ncbi:TMEM87A [Branchiostoma lanceolatum]|uniref:TMEM87A protein n=1 Tax=Branchiostoma lanceolatum TaxID=7740 RepID=A0A8K0ERR7_BRALA|nr:TMEM87A [Branchiostoma lanceolatum]